MKDIEYWIWLSRIEGLNPKFLNDLLEKYGNPKIIWDKTKQELLEDGVKEKYANEITNIIYRQNLDKYSKYMNEKNIEIITIKDKEYPDKLKVIYDPPIVLYVKGNKYILNEKSIAIVGCRLCTKYGENVAKKLSYNLSINNINVISGLAKGIDSFAHKGSLIKNGKTIAVVGCGLDRVYPEENIQLFNQIIKNNGAIISEYIIGTKPLAKNFPRRNRIISGLSDGVVVVEAREKSGTLITVDMALEQGRDVYALPGRIGDAMSAGCNRLISCGAGIVLSPEMLLAELSSTPVSAEILEEINHITDNNHINIEETLDVNERKIYHLLDVYPKSLDMIWEEINHFGNSGMTILEVMNCLVKLCMKELAEQVQGANVYKIKNKYF